MSHFTSRIRPISQQAASFSRSTGDPNQQAKWEAVFGPMPTNAQPNAYSHYPNVNKQLPDAYIGQNVFLSEKVAGLIATTGAFWTGVLLPWLRSDHIGPFSWSRWEFNQVLATRVPHESVARLVTTEQREYQVRPVRRGLAMQMEGDFVNHPDGQIHFARKVQGMIASIQTTIDFDVQHSIITSNDQRKMEQHRIGVNSLPIKEELDIEVDQFAAISKNIDYFKRVVKDAQVYLMDNQVNPPFTLLVTPEAIIDMSYFTKPQVQPQRLIGGTAGGVLDPTGELGRTDLPTGDFVTPDGTAVFQVRSINFGSKGAPYQMFSKPKLVAEYYHMSWARYRESNLFDGTTHGPSEQYYSDMRSILLKNETTDKMFKVTLENALKHGGRGNTGFPDMNIIKGLARNAGYTAKDFDPGVDPITGEPIPEMMHNKIRRRAHMMLTLGLPGSARRVRAVHYVGQMNSNVTSAKNIEQMAQTLIASVPGIGPKDMDTAWNLIELIRTLEDAPYNSPFFQALIKVNAKRNYRVTTTAGRTRFVGATLRDKAHSDKWNTPAGYVEWRPDDTGAMTLPVWDAAVMGDHNVPPGIANYTGLVALRALKSKTHGYGDLPDKADRALSLLAKLGVGFSNSLTTEAMDANNRAPWYLKANPLTTMFETCINIPRDPLFLIAPPYPGGEAGDPDFGGSRPAPTMQAPSLQRIVLNSALVSSTTGTRTSARALRAIMSRLAGTTEGGRIFVESGNPAGPGVVIGNADLALGLALSPTISALRKLGEASGVAYMEINKRLLDEANAEVRFQLAGMINSPGTASLSAQKLTLGLNDIIRGTDDDEALEIIKLTAGGDRSSVRDAINRGAELLETVTDRPLSGIFTSEGDEATVLETLINQGVDATAFARRVPNVADRFAAIGQAVDAILSTISLIHQERTAIRDALIQAAQEADDVEPDEYDANAFFYAFPGSNVTIDDDTTNVSVTQDGDNDSIAALLVQLQQQGQNYVDVTSGIIGALPANFGGLGTNPIPGGRDTRPRTGPTADVEPVFSEDALAASRYYRSSLVMTPGLRDTIGESTNVPLVRPSDPETGHLEPWAGGNGEQFPDRLLNRPQYKSFVNGDFERDFSHTLWNTHHLEFLSYKKRVDATGNVGRRQYADIFSGTGIGSGSSSTLYDDSEYDGGEDDIFGGDGAVEGLLSGAIGAHVPGRASWAYDLEPDTGTGSRPFAGYTGFDSAVLADGDKEDDDDSGAWLINNMNVGSMKYHVLMLNKISNPLVRWAAMAILVSRIDHIDYWLAMIKGNVLAPCNVLLFRPAIEFVMDNFVLMKAGSDTGGTLFNHSSAMLGWDVYTRMIYLNYLFYSKAFIWGPEGIYVIENVMPRRYIAGCGVNFITDIAQLSTARSNDRHDFIAIVVPIEEIEFDEVLGILGDRNQVYGDANPEFDGPMNVPQYSSADYVKAWLNRSDVGSIEQMLLEHKTRRVEYFQTIGTVPPVVFQGYYQTWDGKTFGTVHAGKGHKGDYNDYPGSRKIWNRRGTPYFEERAKQPFTTNV